MKRVLLCVGFVSFLSLLASAGRGQEQPPSQSPPQDRISNSQRPGGAATLGEFAPVLDAEKRPITAGGFVKEGPIVFKDISNKAGLTSWHHVMGTLQKNYIIEVNGSGVAARLRQRWLARHFSCQRLNL
jgi:hypothetical protein